MRYKIVAKWVSSNVVDLGIVFENGHTQQVARLLMPNDAMVNLTVKCVEEIIVALKKRYRNSV